MKKTLTLLYFSILVSTLSFAQTNWTIQNRLNPKMLYADSALRVPVLSSLISPYNNKDSIGQIIFFSPSGKFYGRYSTSVYKPFATEDSTIKNQTLAAQTANYWISGKGTATSYQIYNSTSVPYVPYLSFAHTGSDTTQRVWSLGIQATSGPGNSGENMVFRGYTNAGSFISNALTLSRSGALTVSTVNAANAAIAGGSTSGGTSISTGVSANGTFAHAGATYENGTVTVTGNYTALSTDTWINVNNSSPCTITISNPGSGLAAAGRIYHIKKLSGTSGDVTVVCLNGTSLIEGSTSYVLSAEGQSTTFHDDGTSYFADLDIPTIYNQNSTTQTANFNITGNGTIGGLLTTSYFLATQNVAFSQGIAGKIETVTSNTTLDITNFAVLVNNSGSVTITLPVASINPGTIYIIKKISALSNDVIIDGDGSETIDGTTSKTLTLQNSSLMIQSNGVNWFILSSYASSTIL